MSTVEEHKTSLNRKITFGTKEWADYNVNCIKGCYNNCRYCYARIMSNRFRRSTSLTWKNMKIRNNILKKRFNKRPGRVMFPSTHDIFDFAPFKEACFAVLGNLLVSNNDVLVTTKPRFTVVKEIVETFGCYKDHIQFRFTITSNSDALLKFWEPNAPTYYERFKSLKYAHQEGFKTSVSVEPFLDYDPTELVRTITPFASESIWVGRMNYIPKHSLSEVELRYYNEIRRNYGTHHLQEICSKLARNPKIRIKDSIRLQLSGSARSYQTIAF